MSDDRHVPAENWVDRRGSVSVGDRVLIRERDHPWVNHVGDVVRLVQLRILGEDAGPHAEVRIDGAAGIVAGVPIDGVEVLR